MSQVPPPPPSGPEYDAAAQVKGPAIGLLVTAIVGLIVVVSNLVMNFAGISAYPEGEIPPWAEAMSGTAGIIGAIIGLAIVAVIFMGAQKMKRLESHGFVMAASILAMVPCISPCCVLGLPFGIWALIVINKPEVKAAFR